MSIDLTPEQRSRFAESFDGLREQNHVIIPVAPVGARLLNVGHQLADVVEETDVVPGGWRPNALIVNNYNYSSRRTPGCINPHKDTNPAFKGLFAVASLGLGVGEIDNKVVELDYGDLELFPLKETANAHGYGLPQHAVYATGPRRSVVFVQRQVRPQASHH
jgi:hypothetical protein